MAYEDLEVKLCPSPPPSPDGEETFIMYRSAASAGKEKAMHERFATRVEDGIEKLARRLARASSLASSGRQQAEATSALSRSCGSM